MSVLELWRLGLCSVAVLIAAGFLWVQREHLLLDRQRAEFDCEIRATLHFEGDARTVIAMCEQRFQTTIPRK